MIQHAKKVKKNKKVPAQLEVAEGHSKNSIYKLK